MTGGIKSSFCGESGACVIVHFFQDYVKVTDPEGHVVTYTHNEWDVFVQGVKAGEFDNQ